MILLALLWPFAALVLATYDFKYRNYVLGVISVAIMVGICEQVVATNYYEADITRNLANAAFYKDMPWGAIFLEKDYFLGLSGKLLCYISDDLHFLAVCYTLIKATLYLRCVKIIVNHYAKKEQTINHLPLLAMLFVVSFYDINSLRYTIASVYFLWCSLEILINDKKLFYALILLSPFIHFGFWIMIPTSLLFLLLKNRTKIVWIIFILSLFFSNVNTSYRINDFVASNMDDVIAESVEGYASERGIESMSMRYKDGATYGNVNRAISRSLMDIRSYGVMLCAIILSISGFKKWKMNSNINSLMNYLLILYSLANLANSNSQGGRYYLLSAMVAIFIFVFMMCHNDVQYEEFYKTNKAWINIAYIIVIVVGVFVVYMCRDYYNLTGVIFGNYLLHF